ncbi:hypothetical protein ACOJIV_20625 [Haloarcula sp. AONF1]
MSSRREFLGAAAALGTLGGTDTVADADTSDEQEAGADVDDHGLVGEELIPAVSYEISFEQGGDSSLRTRSIRFHDPDGMRAEAEIDITAGPFVFTVALDREAATSLADGLADVTGRWFVDGGAYAGYGSDHEDCTIAVSALTPIEFAERIDFRTEHGTFQLNLSEEERDQFQAQLRGAVDDASVPDR